ncbi:hypothetical protein H2O64_11285 [Kordia sp. YSTF-M3]|uniref:Uncharacterized protein n=1 Tax=Kordia aestuariivivens TaxID=2759037 RepID=A0ABR7Q9L8_9FLAO|nr:hypothetical protein [Kordia aestuariivivens]MBC8755260.1 hypothetical protein [Kordia aestuariivivens]
MKIVRNLIRVLCILTIGSSLTNCQNDTITEMQEEATVQKEFPFKSTLLTRQDLEANSKLSNQMRSLATIQNSSIAESTYNETYNFTVHTNIVKFVESTENNSHSYTFPIDRDNSTGSTLENLVFSYNVTTDDYEASLVTYHFSAAQQQEFVLTQHVATPHEITYMPIAVNLSDIVAEDIVGMPCTTIYTVYHITPGPDSGTFLYSTNGNVQNTCEHEFDDDPCDTYTVIEINCPDGGSGSGSGTDDNTSTDPYSSPNNTPSGGSTASDDNTTPPNDDDNNDIVTSPISKEEYLEITQQLDDAFGEDGWELAEEPLVGEESFDSVEELEAYMDSMPTNISASQTSTQALQNGDVITRFTFPTTQYVNLADLNVEIVSKTENFQTGQEFEVVGVNSYLSGLTVVKDWEANENYSVSTSSSNGNYKVVIMTGIIKTGTSVGGIEIHVKQTATIRMEINKYNGDEGYSNMTLVF